MLRFKPKKDLPKQQQHPKRVRDPRISTIQWAKQFYASRTKLEDVVVGLEKKSEKSSKSESPSVSNHSLNTTDDTENVHTAKDKEPINILCFDGGGLKAYGHVFMIEEILKKVDGDLFCEYFDLAAGTSAGGIAALILSMENGNSKSWIKEAYRPLDAVREKGNISLLRLLRRGHAANQGINTYKNLYGDTQLYNPKKMKAFALATLRIDEDDQDMNSKFEPFLMRSYDFFYDAPENQDASNQDTVQPLPGTSDLKVYEAMAASSAAPVAFERVGVNVAGEHLRFGDGGIISNSPVALAIQEARCLWPDRPLGTIVSFGLSSIEKEDVLNVRAINACKEANPDMHYCRLFPEADFPSTEMRTEKIEELRKAVKTFIHETQSKEIDEMIANLVSTSKPRVQNVQRRRRHDSTRPSMMSQSIFARKSSLDETKQIMKRISVMAANRRSMISPRGPKKLLVSKR